MYNRKYLEDHKIVLDRLSSSEEGQEIEEIAQAIAQCFVNSGKLYICGAGSSKMIAGYMVDLLLGSCGMERPPLPAVNLIDTLPHTKYDDVYERQVSAFVTSDDMVLGIVSDSRQEPVIKALRSAAYIGAKTLGLCGENYTSMKGVCDILLNVADQNHLTVNEFHIIAINGICQRVEQLIFISPADIV